MYVLRAQEQLQTMNVIAVAFGGLDKDTRTELINGLREQADIESKPEGINLSELDANTRAAVLGRFGIPVVSA